ncbi:MAG TPA: NfeD family protein [Candidatus Binatia bacterium]
MLLGAALLVVEIAQPGSFFVLFFGIGAIVVGALVGIGLLTEAWTQWLLFSVTSVATLLVFRSRLLARFQRSKASTVGSEGLIGERATLLEDLEPGDVGRAELRGSVWKVRSREQQRLASGARVRVEHVDGLTLWVRPE